MDKNSKTKYSKCYSALYGSPYNKGYLTSFKKTTNPNVSPIGKRFGFECLGAGDRTQTGTLSPAVDFESTSAFGTSQTTIGVDTARDVKALWVGKRVKRFPSKRELICS